MYIIKVIKFGNNFNYLEAPKLNKEHKISHQPEGAFFSLFCIAQQGSQPLFFQWFKDGHLIDKQSNEYEIKLIDDRQSMFKINKITSNDSGNYSCNVKNAFGEDNHTVKLIVKG